MGDNQSNTTTDQAAPAPVTHDQPAANETPAPAAPSHDTPPALSNYIMTDDHGQAADTVPAQSSNDDLAAIKQEALKALGPLVNQLDQPPAERFKVIMMMIQAGDDQSLIPQAYEAAKQIETEKERAQALLDVVNEINYFTQQPAN